MVQFTPLDVESGWGVIIEAPNDNEVIKTSSSNMYRS
jgi:hypothetical protein